MNEAQLGILTTCFLWAVLTGLLAFGIWSIRRRRWLIGVVCILVALPFPLLTLSGMIAMNRVNVTLQSKGEPIYTRFGKIDSALKSDTLPLKTKSSLSKLVARDRFVFEGRIEKYIEENGSINLFSPDSADRALMLNMKITQKFVESITIFGLLFLSTLPIGLIAGSLLPIEMKSHRRRD